MIALSLLTLGTGALSPTVARATAKEGQIAPVLDRVKSEIPVFEDNPQSTALFPTSLLEWSPETDDNAAFNVSNVELVPRVKGPKINPYQSEEAKLLSIAIVNRHTAGTPSQGGGNKEIYNFTNWQYVDTLVAWAGSAGEGIIVPPSGDITDAAHRNGVPVIGTVFFPPEAYGGKAQWVKDFVKKDSKGNYIVADKLLAMADYYGFDGWFINQETNVDPETAAELENLLLYLQNNKQPDHQIIWYDSMLPSGKINWQGALNSQNERYFQNGSQKMSDNMFLDFRWNKDRLTTSKAKALELNRSPFDLFAGLDVQARGTNTRLTPEDILDENGQLKMSIGLYCPDWTLRDGGNYDMEQYWKNEQALWTNTSNDPREVKKPAENNWFGISKYIVEKTPVTAFPFVTNFNVGNGDNFYQNGALVRPGTFNNRSIQDVLPTYRWIIDNGQGNSLQADFSYEDAFNGGSSIMLSGEMAKDSGSFFKLYATDLLVTGNEGGYLVTKGTSKIELVVETAENDQKTILQSQNRTQEDSNDWDQDFFSFDELAGQTITSVGVNVYGDETGNQKILIGSLLLGDLEQSTKTSQVENVTVSGKTVQDDLTESVRLSWQSLGENTGSYNIYREDENGTSLVGTTSNTSFVLLDQKRSTESPKYIVVPKDRIGKEDWASKGSVAFEFNQLKAPEMTVSANSTFVKVGEEVVLTAKASPSTETITWQIPEGEILEESQKSVTVKFEKPGAYSVFAQATNSAGTTEVLKENYIYVYDESQGMKIENLSVLPDVTATEGSGFTNASENYQKALDGNLSTKWCDNGSKNPYMIVDLGAVKTITGFALHNAQAGGENAEWNTKDYDILVSDDKENWETVVEHRNNTAAISQDTIAKVEARYVKLYLQKAESSGNTARIYEFQILGINGKDIEVTENAELIGKLRNLYYTGKAKIAENYTPESFAVLTKSLETTKQALENPGTTEELMQQMTELTEAIDQLVLADEFVSTEPLKQLLATAKKFQEDYYTSESFALLTKIIKEVEPLAEKETLPEKELNYGMGLLTEAVGQLLLESEEAKLSLLNQLELTVSVAKELALTDLYTEETIANFNRQIEEASLFIQENRAVFRQVVSEELAESAELHVIKLLEASSELKLAANQSDAEALANYSEAAENAKKQVENDFTPESYRQFKRVVNRIEGAHVDQVANTGYARFASNVLNAAVANLVVDEGETELKIEKEKLRVLIKTVRTTIEESSPEEYETGSMQRLEQALEVAESALEATTLQEVKTAYTELEQAYQGLTPQDNSLKRAREKLQGAVDELAKVDVSHETPKEKEETQLLLTQAKEVLNQNDATLSALEEMTAKVQQKIAELTDPTTAKEALATVVKAMSAVQSDFYTPESFNSFETALQSGKALLAKQDATKNELIVARKAIEDTHGSLVAKEKVDKLTLEKLVKEAEQYKKAEYTKDSFEQFLEALEAAQLVLVDPSATQDQVNQATKNLQEKSQNLVKIQSSGDKNQGGTNQNGKGEIEKGGGNPSKQGSQAGHSGKNLPQANENRGVGSFLIGSVMMIIAGVSIFKKKKSSN